MSKEKSNLRDSIKKFTTSDYYPTFIEECKKFVKKYSNEIIVDKSNEYEEAIEK